MKKRKVLAAGLAAVMAVSMVAAFPASAADDTVTIVLGHYGAANEPVTEAADKLAEEVEELSGGSIIIEVHGNSELGDAPEMTEQTSMGAIQATLVTQASLDKYDIRYCLTGAPYMFTSYEQAYAVIDGPFAEWVGDGTLESKGLHNVGAWDYGFRCLTNSVREVAHPEDVEGLKIRTPAEIQKVCCYEALGADVQQVAFSELITALKQGTVDGQENPLSTIYNNALWECDQKYLSLTRHTYDSVNLVVNNDFWEGLTDDQRAIIEEANADCSAYMRELVQNDEADYIQKLADEGMEVTEVDLEEFQACMGPAWEAMVEYEGSQEDMDYFLDMIANCEY